MANGGVFQGIPGVDGTVTTVAIRELNLPPTNIIAENQAWQAQVTMDLYGPAVAVLAGGTVTATAYFDGVSAGFKGQIGTQQWVIPATLGPYHHTIMIPCPAANSVIPGGPIGKGLFSLDVVLTIDNAAHVSLPLAGYSDGGYVLIY